MCELGMMQCHDGWGYSLHLLPVSAPEVILLAFAARPVACLRFKHGWRTAPQLQGPSLHGSTMLKGAAGRALRHRGL